MYILILVLSLKMRYLKARLMIQDNKIVINQMGVDFESSINYSDLIVAYQITMFSMWGIGVDFPRLLARYARSYPMVINIHSISMMIIGLMTLMYVTARTITFYDQPFKLGQRLEGVQLVEFVFSWFLCGFILIQFALGFKLKYEMFNDKLSKNMFTLKKAHRYLGTFMSLFGKIIVALELATFQNPTDQDNILFRGWLFLVGALILIFIVMEVVYRVQTRSIMLKFPLKHQSKHIKHLMQIYENINNNVENFPDYKELGVRYIILDNKMYYIDQNFIHPGGQHIFTMYNGQEVNYLFRGTHQPSPNFPRHNHTKYAFNYLQQRQIGKIQVESILLNFNEDSQDLVDWRLTAIEQMQGDSNLVQFSTNNSYVRQNLNVQTFGKYMMISCPSQQVIDKQKRPYSLIISLSNQQKAIQHRFKQKYKSYYNIQNSVSSLQKNQINEEMYDLNQRKSSLTFCIKNYKNGLFTKFMFSSQAQRKFLIMGPYGRGLRLKPMSKGFYIIIAAGTGILPFIDLFHFMLLKTLIRLIGSRAGESAAKKINEERYDYSLLPDVRILFIGSFISSKHFYLDNVVKDLYHLNRKHQLNEFDMRLRYNSGQTEPDVTMIRQFIDKKYIQQLLQMKPDRIYYCGPPSIENVIRKVESQSNQKNKFFFI